MLPFALKFGTIGIRKCFRSQIEMLRREGLENLGIYIYIYIYFFGVITFISTPL
jgi:hypothetical protein